jgi:signal transduction histidine kinase
MAEHSSRFAARLSLVQDVRLARDDRGMAEIVNHGASLDAALEAERLRREAFVATLAHELRQPLTTLLAAIEVLRLAPDSGDANRATAIMKRQIGQMNRVVEDIMDAARWRRGKVKLRKQQLDVREVIKDAAQDVEAAVVERRHQLVVATAPEPLWADADPQRLHQVLSNLLRNAVKYTDPGGRISLTADRGATTVEVRVSDTGCGIEADALSHIFDLYSQVRPEETRGLGIGLSVVREIVALHEGKVEARSDGPGRGSQFIVSLPAATASRGARGAAHHSSGESAFSSPGASLGAGTTVRSSRAAGITGDRPGPDGISGPRT